MVVGMVSCDENDFVKRRGTARCPPHLDNSSCHDARLHWTSLCRPLAIILLLIKHDHLYGLFAHVERLKKAVSSEYPATHGESHPKLLNTIDHV